ncbi:uncharacterized protein HD556DRAFT_495754 [Suillus plorans]|uniref:Transmembrane protein n=1 Tax=Suillus plorans TaxID=116603 RepID=A0A9P7J6H0_9AGAM|nr:uncharacterized protein HD556DRAFT_495754 [Suillus plorans]KAG1804973.1 hypothetical protein HD556DRAFT_495754 [Suillus plorans]
MMNNITKWGICVRVPALHFFFFFFPPLLLVAFIAGALVFDFLTSSSSLSSSGALPSPSPVGTAGSPGVATGSAGGFSSPAFSSVVAVSVGGGTVSSVVGTTAFATLVGASAGAGVSSVACTGAAGGSASPALKRARGSGSGDASGFSEGIKLFLSSPTRLLIDPERELRFPREEMCSAGSKGEPGFGEDLELFLPSALRRLPNPARVEPMPPKVDPAGIDQLDLTPNPVVAFKLEPHPVLPEEPQVGELTGSVCSADC